MCKKEFLKSIRIIKKAIKRLWVNKEFVFRRSLNLTSMVLSFIGVIGLFVPITDLLEHINHFVVKIFIGLCIILVIWFVTFIISCFVFFLKRRFSVIGLQNHHHVYVQYGDVFSEDEVLDPSKRRNIVIDFNRCFDTKVNDDLISSTSLHGQTVNKILNEKDMDYKVLNSELQADLCKRQHLIPEQLSIKAKRDGNLKRFPAGSIAEYKLNEKEVYFCLGLSTLNYDLTANTSSDEYGKAIMSLIEYIQNRSQGLSVVMPILGVGLAKTENDERDTLEFMVKAFKLYRRKLNCDIHIIVWEGKDPISITDL